MSIRRFVAVLLVLASCSGVHSQETVVVRPREIDDVLVNPGIGFMTFQRFNGDKLNAGKKWTEGFPIEYQPFNGKLENEDHPMTSLAYFRVYWKFLEPAKGQYRWDLIDQALKTAGERRQTLLLRIAPYGTGPERDVPAWYRAMLGPEPNLPRNKWQTNPEDPRYVEHFGGLVRALGKRYDGHPLLESVDLAIVGAWGEGDGSNLLTPKTREALVDCYLEAFPKTHLLMLLTDEKTNKYGLSKRNVGWRVDCLGDMGGFSKTWSHMHDAYPQQIINCGMKDAWQKAPVSLEVCWVVQHWKDMGWDIDYIIDQSLKWHISSFNGKSSAVPKEWQPHVDRWLKKMGYRLALRKFTYPTKVKAGAKIEYTSWWENKGVAPCYHPFRLALRVRSAERSIVLPTAADIRTWLPGDNLHDAAVALPADVPPGQYDLAIGILDERTDQPRVKLAIAGADAEGWYRMGTIQVEK
jgi:hypothetical protein